MTAPRLGDEHLRRLCEAAMHDAEDHASGRRKGEKTAVRSSDLWLALMELEQRRHEERLDRREQAALAGRSVARKLTHNDAALLIRTALRAASKGCRDEVIYRKATELVGWQLKEALLIQEVASWVWRLEV